MFMGLKQGIDERRDGRNLGQNQQAAKDDHHEENGQQPEFLPLAHKRPKLD
jgi:hypothetical protein